MEISLPIPEPATDAQRAEFADMLEGAAKAINKMLREWPGEMPAADLTPLIAELQRFFAQQEAPPEVLALLAWHRSR